MELSPGLSLHPEQTQWKRATAEDSQSKRLEGRGLVLLPIILAINCKPAYR